MRQGLVAILNQDFAQIRIRTNKVKVPYCVLEDDLVGVCTKEPLINLRIMAHCAFDSRATVWTGS